MKHIFLSLLQISIFAVCSGQVNESQNTKDPLKDTVQVKMGQKLLFKAEVNASKNLQFSQIADITDSTKCVTIDLIFTEGIGTMLKIYNPFTEQMVYKAELYSYKKKDFVVTSTVPVFPRISSYETWPFRIELIQLSGFKLVATK
ncbi:MAG: hypothetical protein U0T79_09265 [Ferruginibacter sp.]